MKYAVVTTYHSFSSDGECEVQCGMSAKAFASLFDAEAYACGLECDTHIVDVVDAPKCREWFRAEHSRSDHLIQRVLLESGAVPQDGHKYLWRKTEQEARAAAMERLAERKEQELEKARDLMRENYRKLFGKEMPE